MVGLVRLGFEPRVTFGLRNEKRRLDKILAEIQGCRYSIHDLSRVAVDRNPPFSTPRFNMPFELGLADAWEQISPTSHTWFVFEAKTYRVQKSLSDLNGYDPQIHDGRVQGIMRELCNAFVRPKNQPTVPEMMAAYRFVLPRTAKIMADTGAASLFEAWAFRDLCFVSKGITEKLQSQ